MIKSFTCEETEKIYNREYSRKLPSDIQSVAMRKLWMLDAAVVFNDLRVPPSNHLELLQPKKKSCYSIRINKQWRICFVWDVNGAEQVEIIDYH